MNTITTLYVVVCMSTHQLFRPQKSTADSSLLLRLLHITGTSTLTITAISSDACNWESESPFPESLETTTCLLNRFTNRLAMTKPGLVTTVCAAVPSAVTERRIWCQFVSLGPGSLGPLKIVSHSAPGCTDFRWLQHSLLHVKSNDPS